MNRSTTLLRKLAMLFLTDTILDRDFVEYLKCRLTFFAMTTDGESQKTFVALITHLAQPVRKLSWHLLTSSAALVLKLFFSAVPMILEVSMGMHPIEQVKLDEY
ncbi:hypothetical protein P3T76_008814 [Phytophthora citrophthora]|uniref:Uncharacterized protein n=1 Tax=Phytophthora citrophthora TaxID=4793 RepID=A0AAD9GIY4_9STRA|nr:hypothetical protein P3T76_008814 [Phytophthora citrophthora]